MNLMVASLVTLSKHANLMRSLTDYELNRRLVTIQRRINALNLGVAAWVDVTSLRPVLESGLERVGYARVSGEWGMAVEADGGQRWPMLSSRRALRVDAVGLIPSILEALVDASEVMVKRLDAAVKLAESMVLAIGGELTVVQGEQPVSIVGGTRLVRRRA